MENAKLKNTYIIIISWALFLLASIILKFLKIPSMPLTISDNLWVLPVCIIPLLTILLEDYLSNK
ncbi:MAG: hypothetical protein OdinLCB4_000720 [Candidatus Odinarchaeum yellowstonii]|uniref:Uncharacterized protein n=1 Tax=Odinarchaeota yellowstonii (strain LCB_4) TaxID=1841599 RepID=A0AAF0D2M1_ODILC|nr:MAG: hypothetical protein OdinLCB4_000720 [Candidatus Odinarchaeum yellowstonii]